jgi:hypothetical protein
MQTDDSYHIGKRLFDFFGFPTFLTFQLKKLYICVVTIICQPVSYKPVPPCLVIFLRQKQKLQPARAVGFII